MALVTISAPYGTGGSRIGPALARRLDVPFVDRAIPAAVAERLAVPLSDALSRDEAVSGVLARMLLSFGPAAQALTTASEPVGVVGDREYLEATEQVINEQAASGNGVLLGRGAAVVLREDQRALHVRLGGPEHRRVAHAMQAEGIDQETAERRLKETDRARDAYLRHFYRVDPRDPTLYHLMIDATVIGEDACVEMIVIALRERERGPQS